jgi:hypothetical protein
MKMDYFNIKDDLMNKNNELKSLKDRSTSSLSKFKSNETFKCFVEIAEEK